MKKLRDVEYTEARIKISKVKEHYSDRKGNHDFKNKLICVSFTHPTYISSTCFKDNKKGEQDLIKFIKKELHFNFGIKHYDLVNLSNYLRKDLKHKVKLEVIEKIVNGKAPPKSKIVVLQDLFNNPLRVLYPEIDSGIPK